VNAVSAEVLAATATPDWEVVAMIVGVVVTLVGSTFTFPALAGEIKVGAVGLVTSVVVTVAGAASMGAAFVHGVIVEPSDAEYAKTFSKQFGASVTEDDMVKLRDVASGEREAFSATRVVDDEPVRLTFYRTHGQVRVASEPVKG
jgi:hypothetical protein